MIKIAEKSAIAIPSILIVGALVVLAYYAITLRGPTTGTLVLDVTPPGAVLTLDGKQIGPAKDFSQEFSAGTHVIEISADNYVATKQTVTIVAGDTLHVPLQLALIPTPPPPSTKGALVLDVATPGAVLTLDGKEIGPAKDFYQELPAGTHVIETSANGCAPTKQTVTIVAGETLRVPIQLALVPPPQPMKGSLVLDVATPGAILTLDGKQIGPAKDFRQELSAGTHVIEISANGCVPTKQTVTIVAGDTLRVSLQLIRWIRKTRQWVKVEPCS